MSRTLYLECGSGISGDMTVAALLDLGADENILRQALSSIPVGGFQVQISRVNKSGLDVCDFNVVLNENNYDHDLEYLHGKDYHESHHEPHHHGEHRGLTEIIAVIESTKLTPKAKDLAVEIFRRIAKAEAKAHGVSVEKVHFHEVGAVDSIVDVIAAAVCFDDLNITKCIIPYICEGRGTIRCQHGILPVPVPAVTNIVTDSPLQLSIMNVQGEFVTPTGAALAATFMTSSELPEHFSIKKVGMGGGKREYERPSILRAMLIEEQGKQEDYIYKLESNIDDCSGENFGFVMEKLFAAGARDVHFFPVFMKKNRPAYEINVICKEDKVAELEQIIFENTTTIGIRKQKMERSILQRRLEQVETPLGIAQVKVCQGKNISRVYPEYESVAKLAREHRMNYQEVYQMVERACQDANF